MYKLYICLLYRPKGGGGKKERGRQNKEKERGQGNEKKKRETSRGENNADNRGEQRGFFFHSFVTMKERKRKT
jgi:hypothetical protein